MAVDSLAAVEAAAVGVAGNCIFKSFLMGSSPSHASEGEQSVIVSLLFGCRCPACPAAERCYGLRRALGGFAHGVDARPGKPPLFV